MNETLFSSRAFIEAWLRGRGGSERLLAIPVRGSGPPREFCAVQKVGRKGLLRSIRLGPNTMYASPGWEGELDHSTLRGILRVLRSPRTTRIQWIVRFDHGALAAGLIAEGLPFTRWTVHVLDLNCSYENVFANYNATTRNQVRRAAKVGVIVREAAGPDDVQRYCAVCCKAEQQQGYKNRYPHMEHFLPYIHLFNEQTTLNGLVRLLVAEYQGEVIAGGLFFRDGCTVQYWLGVTDRDFSRVYAVSAVLDAAIRWACETGASFFNFSGSGGIESIERFKSAWGADVRENWEFSWSNPLWSRVYRLKAALGW